MTSPCEVPGRAALAVAMFSFKYTAVRQITITGIMPVWFTLTLENCSCPLVRLEHRLELAFTDPAALLLDVDRCRSASASKLFARLDVYLHFEWRLYLSKLAKPSFPCSLDQTYTFLQSMQDHLYLYSIM